VGTEKRERQKVGKQERAAAEFAAARRAKKRRTAVRVAIGVVVVLAVLFGYSALQGDDDGSDTASDDTESTTSTTAAETTTTSVTYSNPELAQEILDREAPDVEPPPENTPADALETETLIEGEGEAAAAGDQLTVNYTGVTPDGNVFDSSWENGQPLPFALGQQMVIPGWDQGMVGAKIGERRRLVIGSDNAYGAEGAGEDIPPNSPLAFVVDVVDIAPGAAAGGSGG
jgi:peptidylprolyl isomerase